MEEEFAAAVKTKEAWVMLPVNAGRCQAKIRIDGFETIKSRFFGVELPVYLW
jgi:hypothetical protein